MLGINLYAIGAAAVVGVALFGAGYYQGTIGQMEREAMASQQAIAAVRAQERQQRDKLSQTLQEQADEQRTINDRLVSDLERMRERAARMPRAAEVDCKGADGSELSGSDAGFLIREAARADELRAALRACYEYADEVSR